MPPSKEVTLGHPFDTTAAVFPSRFMKGHIVASDLQTKLSVHVGLRNGEIKALCVIVHLGAKWSLCLTPMVLKTKSLKNITPANRGAYTKPTTRSLCRGGGG